jgi:iron complex transport system ATP-binding protein
LWCVDVSAAYNGRRVLDGVDLSVAPGEWVGLIGPNGAGKTTLLRVVAGAHVARGRVEVDGDEVGVLSRRQAARRVAVVPQHPVIPPTMTTLEYVLLGRTPFIPYWGNESTEDLRVVGDIMERLDLAGLEGRAMGSLSGGERQRAVLGRALAQEARVLLLDEPTAALDLGHQQRVLDEVDLLRQERRIAVVSALHDLTLAAQYPDRLVLLDGGRVVASGPARRVLDPELLSRHYRASVAVLDDGEGSMVVAPRRARRPGSTTAR